MLVCKGAANQWGQTRLNGKLAVRGQSSLTPSIRCGAWHNATPLDLDKSLTRIYFSGALAAGTEVTLPLEQAHHVTRVLRMQAGDRLTFFNGDGVDYAGIITLA